MDKRTSGELGPVGAPGPEFIGVEKGMEWMEMMRAVSKKYDVDLGEILVGTENVPPPDPECLVYICLNTAWKTEYFRKNKSPNGRWVCWNGLEQVRGEPSQKGTYDFREAKTYI